MLTFGLSLGGGTTDPDEETEITITTDDGTLDTLSDSVTLSLNNYEGDVTWSADSEDIVVTGSENGAATVAFETFEAPSAPSAYEYTITATDAAGNSATYTVKYVPTTYTAKHVQHTYSDSTVSEITDSVFLGSNRYSGEFYIEETAHVTWTLTSENGITYTGNGNINYDNFEAGTYTATAVCTCPDGSTREVSFTVTVEDGGLEM